MTKRNRTTQKDGEKTIINKVTASNKFASQSQTIKSIFNQPSIHFLFSSAVKNEINRPNLRKKLLETSISKQNKKKTKEKEKQNKEKEKERNKKQEKNE